MFFFFQAEDGIRDFHVTGVQTCALPIWRVAEAARERVEVLREMGQLRVDRVGDPAAQAQAAGADRLGGEQRMVDAAERSEERRVGKECSNWWLADHCIKRDDSELTSKCG